MYKIRTQLATHCKLPTQNVYTLLKLAFSAKSRHICHTYQRKKNN